MDIEEEYYEIEDFWKEENISPLDIERIKTVSNFIPIDVDSILDIGCGNGIFLNYLLDNKKYSRLHGVDRSETALKYVRTQKTKSNINLLPFLDNDFDLVTAMEVIEHLPIEFYEMALQEISRISKKYIIISVPNNQILENTLIECESCKSKFNPDYHLRTYDETKMTNLLNNYGFKCINLEFIGEYNKLIFISKLSSSFAKKKNYFINSIPCPVCGYLIEGQKQITSERNIITKNAVIKNVFRKLWPKQINYLWIVGVYEKNIEFH